ncbi:MAG: site-specific tyrosine recombinase [Ilumatobacteraceae bacterium]|nr:tyrosine recombinase XerD [Actinomycetota bacterium]NCZ55642.1 tyrosine recombinase XerD [Acidimicrobiia bacterium]NBS36319.1 tyrosine recombinase XerD [Actinomycetota bacterium]NCV09226.1 tyrosine recombinase XerD [Actinomycetota bacterium]NCX78650.1 tyrosine recombinase XerD [Actinomycetota bacterium]
MTSLAAADRFLAWLQIEQGRSAKTIEAYRRDLRDYEDWLTARGTSALKATTGDVEAFVQALRKHGKAARTVARQFAAVRMLHKYLAIEGERTDDPASLVDGVKVPSGLPKPLREDEIDRLIAAITGDDSFARRDRALVEFLYATGARISEACGLSLGDLDMESSLVRLFGKGSKERIVPFGRGAHRALSDWLDAGGREMLVPGRWRTRDHADAVFLGVHGTRLTRQAAFAIVKKYAGLAGIKEHVSPHTLRHSCATHMLVHGADLRIVQELLGHASVSTTQVYTKVDDELLASVYRESHPRAVRK